MALACLLLADCGADSLAPTSISSPAEASALERASLGTAPPSANEPPREKPFQVAYDEAAPWKQAFYELALSEIEASPDRLEL